MVPYIAALIVLLVAILLAVYKRVDYFEGSSTTLKVDDTLDVVIGFAQKILRLNSDLITRLEAAPAINEELSESKMNELGIPFSMQDGKAKMTGNSVTDALVTSAKQLNTDLKPLIDELTKLNPNMKLNQVLTNNEQVKGFVAVMEIIHKSLLVRQDYLTSKLGARVGSVSTEDLYDAVGGTNQAMKASTVEDTLLERNADVDITKSKERTDSIRDIAPSQTPAATKEMEDRIAKSVATQIKDTLLSQRSTQNMAEEGCPYAPFESNSTAQGKEYHHVKPIQPSPDMSEYIRKDSIPCWNCTLP